MCVLPELVFGALLVGLGVRVVEREVVLGEVSSGFHGFDESLVEGHVRAPVLSSFRCIRAQIDGRITYLEYVERVYNAGNRRGFLWFGRLPAVSYKEVPHPPKIRRFRSIDPDFPELDLPFYHPPAVDAHAITHDRAAQRIGVCTNLHFPSRASPVLRSVSLDIGKGILTSENKQRDRAKMVEQVN